MESQDDLSNIFGFIEESIYLYFSKERQIGCVVTVPGVMIKCRDTTVSVLLYLTMLIVVPSSHSSFMLSPSHPYLVRRSTPVHISFINYNIKYTIKNKCSEER